VYDSAKQDDYDEVDELDSQGHVVSLTQFSGGQLKAAIRFDTAPKPAAPIDQSAGIASAQKAAAQLGLVADPPSLAYVDPSSGGWDVRWDRYENGIQVRGDGTLVRVWADGRILSVSRSSHSLAVAPSATLDAGVATSQVDASLRQITASNVGGLKVGTPVLEWVRPNGAFDATRPIDEDPVCKLAWVVDVQPSGGQADSFTKLTIFIDAGNGSLLGGDVVE
jgi:hypothetical protein